MSILTLGVDNWLVVWTPLKNISQLGWLFPIYGKTKNVPNHQPDKTSCSCCLFHVSCSNPWFRWLTPTVLMVTFPNLNMELGTSKKGICKLFCLTLHQVLQIWCLSFSPVSGAYVWGYPVSRHRVFRGIGLRWSNHNLQVSNHKFSMAGGCFGEFINFWDFWGLP